MKLTQWFGIDVAPVNEGVYELLQEDGLIGAFAVYADGMWYCAGIGLEAAQQGEEQGWKSISCYNGDYTHWRGVAK